MAENEAALIVGAGPGLGEALGRGFADAGLQVALAARREAPVKVLAQGIGPWVRAYACNATREAEVDALFRAVEADVGPLAVVVHNVGAFSRESLLDATVENVERAWRSAALSAFLVGRAAARAMTPRGEGVILFTGATGSLRGSALFQNSAMAKAAVRALSQSMAREFGPKGLHVAHVVIDGAISKSGEPHEDEDAGLHPDEIAEAYVQLYRQGRSAWTQELDLRPWKERF